MSLNDPIVEAISAVPERTAFVIGDARISFRELGASVERAAATLSSRGVSAGDRIALVDGAGLSSTATVLGCARIGAAAAPMSTRLTAPEISALSDAAGCRLPAVAGPEAAPAVTEAFGAEPLDERSLLAGRGPVPAAAVPGHIVAVVLFTSGTTGVPKPIPLTHAVLERRIRGFAAAPDPSSPPAVSIMCVPFHHVAGLIGVLVGLAGGNTSVIQRRFDAGEWLELVARERAQRAFLVPAMLRRILEHPALAGTDLSSLQMIAYGAAPAPAELVERAVEALPQVAFLNVFGQTETLGAVTALGPEDHRAGRAGSVGRPMPGVEIRIVDPATGNDVADGEVGEFWVRAPYTVSEGWVRSGDLVRRDAEGFLYATGRLSDVINRGGEKIDPGEVEAALRAHPAVSDAAAFGVPDPELGERVAAVVVARTAIEGETLRDWCAARLARFKVPDRILLVETLPLTELGKVSRRDLRTLYAERSDP